jgi:hypothetical protein
VLQNSKTQKGTRHFIFAVALAALTSQLPLWNEHSSGNNGEQYADISQGILLAKTLIQ